MMHERGKEYVCGLNDQDLVEYVLTSTSLYLAEAVEFAAQELQRRDIDLDRLTELYEEAKRRIEARLVEATASVLRPLGTWGRVRAFMFGMIGGPHLLMHLFFFADRPQTQRMKDQQRFELIGLGTVLLIIMVVAIFNSVMHGNPPANP